ncbi:hypothetical protein AQ490_03645 [Wenjunlia vitaminophila]|uniref:Nucleopolyhedrovirus P10 family protein n=1 Tax=Wenjunlia vitaminophila TaxID=76728 RepID=A0A0T6LTQ5_WENVI|nr:hypothetical protein [Wenjunlia vitaminophila]KRV49297.1 hypothetical protein AQ490_03645 [Wenjunlia vitaminophila]
MSEQPGPKPNGATGGLTAAVRYQVGLGQFLPLGEAGDDAWIAEAAAASLLRAAGEAVDGVWVTRMRVRPDDGGGPPPSAAPVPAGAAPRVPLRVCVDLEVALDALHRSSLPDLTDQVRLALLRGADTWVGLRVSAVDLSVVNLRDRPSPGDPHGAPGTPDGDGPADGDTAGAALVGRGDEGPGPGPEGRAARAALAVPGVAGLDAGLGGLLPGRVPGVRIEDDGVLVHLRVAPGHRPLDVARAVRGPVAAAVPDGDAHPGRVPVTVVVTGVREPDTGAGGSGTGGTSTG